MGLLCVCGVGTVDEAEGERKRGSEISLRGRVARGVRGGEVLLKRSANADMISPFFI